MPLPTTGFEDRDLDGSWTTFAEEASYTSALMDAAPGIRREVIGQGERGHDLLLYKVGTGPRHIFMFAQVHGNEVAGRDALLSLMRDWATDPDLADYRQEATLLLLPTARPDSMSTRRNANGININRNYVRVSQGETRAIQGVMTDYHPEIVVDVHEFLYRDNAVYATSKVLNPNIHSGVFDLSDEMEQSVKTAIESGGWTWMAYGGHNITGPEYGHNMGGLRHAVGILLESGRYISGPNTQNANRRYLTQMTALQTIRQWHAANISRIHDASTASREAAAGPSERVELIGGTQTSGPVVTPAPDGYIITGDDRGALSTAAEVFGLEYSDTGDGRYSLSARNESRYLIHYLADWASPQRIVSGVRDQDGDDPPPPSSTPPQRVPVKGVAGVLYRTGGRTYRVTPPRNFTP